MKILVSGASGMIGSALVPRLETQGCDVVRLGRSGETGTARWDPERGVIERSALEGLDAVIHLAGANIAGGRWTAARRRSIVDSRIRGTRLLVDALVRVRPAPRVFICASAIGFYGDTGEDLVDENAPAGRGFLAEVCRQWEEEAGRAAAQGTRVVLLRLGLVLARSGGALGKMLPVFRAGLGGPVGSGRQWVSWISIEDVLGAIAHALGDDRLAGPVNAASPHPVRNREFAETLGRVLGRPAFVTAPAAVLRLLFGQMAEETVLASSRVEPRRLRESGYVFRHESLEAALREVLGR